MLEKLEPFEKLEKLEILKNWQIVKYKNIEARAAWTRA